MLTKGLRWLFLLSGLWTSADATAAQPVTLPLRVRGRYIVDGAGERVKFSCVNWYGAHMKTFVQNGLQRQGPKDIARTIAAMGFNCVRLSYSTEAYVHNPAVRPSYISALGNRSHRRFLDLFDEVVNALTSQNVMVIINNHNTYAGWCCALHDGSSLWYNKEYSERAWIDSLAGFAKRYRDNQLVVGYDLRNEPRFDTLTFTSPVWGNMAAPSPFALVDWRAAVERGGAAVLEQNPDALIVVALLEGNYLCEHMLRGYPLRGLDGHVVWNAHEYFWMDAMHIYVNEVCLNEARDTHYGGVLFFLFTFNGEIQTGWKAIIAHACWLSSLIIARWVLVSGRRSSRCGHCCRTVSGFLAFAVLTALICLSIAIGVAAGACASGAVFCPKFSHAKPIRSYEEFATSRDYSYGHLAKSGVGPVWVSEFGTDKLNEHWNWTITYLRERDLDFAYWSLDGDHFPSEASLFEEHVPGLDQEESYGVLRTDYRTVRHSWKLHDLQTLLQAPRGPMPVVPQAASAPAAKRGSVSEEL